MAETSTVPFIVGVVGKGGSGSVSGTADVNVETLRRNLQRATAGLGEVFSDIARVGLFELTEVTLGLEVGAEGGVHFIGTSKVQASASVTLKFSPPENQHPRGHSG